MKVFLQLLLHRSSLLHRRPFFPTRAQHPPLGAFLLVSSIDRCLDQRRLQLDLLPAILPLRPSCFLTRMALKSDHTRFMKVIKAAKGAAAGGVGGVPGGSSDSSAVTKRLNSDLLGVSPAEVSRHESWYRLRGVHLAKKRAEKQVGRAFVWWNFSTES